MHGKMKISGGREGLIKKAEREMEDKDERRKERGRQEEQGETITSLECGQSQAGPGPMVNHRGCLVPFPSSGRQTNGWIHVGIKRLCSPQMEL